MRVTALVLASIWAAASTATAQTSREGESVFRTKCVACHTVGGGNLVGPDLRGVTTRRDRAWLARWIAAPDRMLAAGDSLATGMLREFNNVPMPNLGLTDADVTAVIGYLESQIGTAAGQTAASPATPPMAPPAADARLGRDLFMGVERLRGGGPPCLACHSIAGIGALGGGALGPDLTPAYGKYGDAGLAAVLAAIPFPTMSPIFGPRPLTTEEQANLSAFLRQATAAKRPVRAAGRLAVLAVLGAGALLGLARLTWRRRLVSVRHPLVHGAARTRFTRTPAAKGA